MADGPDFDKEAEDRLRTLRELRAVYDETEEQLKDPGIEPQVRDRLRRLNARAKGLLDGLGIPPTPNPKSDPPID